jgi:hypothetical protein
MKKRTPPAHRRGTLRGTPEQHSRKAGIAINDATRFIQRNDCYEALLALGAASAHMDESRDDSPLFGRWTAVDSMVRKRCRLGGR